MYDQPTTDLERRLGRYLKEAANRVELPEGDSAPRSPAGSFSWALLPAAAMVTVLVIIGTVLIRGAGLSAPMSDPEPSVAPFGPVTSVDQPVTTVTPDSTVLGEGQVFEEARIAVEMDGTKISGVQLITSDGQSAHIASDFSSLHGEHLPLPVVSDGHGGFVLTVVDYDDSRTTRDAYVILFLPARRRA
ncbi:MAG: hypothetical protein GEU79_04885 [Acidimicrobiia bacterium]|nr:hypothetical protein [Acidimicrobiia bacterium]